MGFPFKKRARRRRVAAHETPKSSSVSFIRAAEGVPQAGQPAPPRAQMLALTSYLILLSYFNPTILFFLLPIRLGAFGGAKGFLEVPSA